MQEHDIIASVESLEAQLDRAKESLIDGDWDRLEQLAGGMRRTAAYLASAVSIAKAASLAGATDVRFSEPAQAKAASSSAS